MIDESLPQSLETHAKRSAVQISSKSIPYVCGSLGFQYGLSISTALFGRQDPNRSILRQDLLPTFHKSHPTKHESRFRIHWQDHL